MFLFCGWSKFLGETVACAKMPVTFTPLRTIEVKETESIFDCQFHPEKDLIFAVATVDGDVHM